MSSKHMEGEQHYVTQPGMGSDSLMLKKARGAAVSMVSRRSAREQEMQRLGVDLHRLKWLSICQIGLYKPSISTVYRRLFLFSFLNRTCC